MFLLLFAVTMSVQAQKVHRLREVKSVAFGAIKLKENEGMYYLSMKTGNRYEPTFSVVLGDSANAVRLLTFIADLHIESDEVVELQNPSNNHITKDALGSFLVHDETGVFKCNMHRTHARSLLEALTGQKAKGKQKDKRPAYMRNIDY